MIRLRPSFLIFSPALALGILLSGCGGDGSGPTTVASISAPGGTSLTGTVGQALPIQVVVTGSNGKAYAGGTVAFTVTAGGGSVSPAQANTGQTGAASTTWTLGTTAGTQGLSASIQGASVQFTATVQAGSPASIEAVSTFPGQFPPGQALPQPATFSVRDQYNNGVGGVSVTFQASGGGSANPAQGTTGSDGRVSTTWTLGPLNGTQTLSASIAGVNPATVSVEAFDPCSDFKSYSVGQTANGTLTSASCEIEFAGQVRFSDLYTFNIGATGAYRFNIQSDFDDPLLLLLAPGAVAGRIEIGNSLEVKALLDNGGSTKQYYSYIAGGPGGVGDYQFSSQGISSAMIGCENWVSTRNVNTNQQLDGNDCYWEGPYYTDLIEVWLDEGETVTIDMTSPNTLLLDPYLELLTYDAGTDLYTVVQEDDDSGGNLNARIQRTVTTANGGAGFYFIGPTTAFAGETGNYTLTISSTGGSGSPPEVGSRTVSSELLPVPPGVSGDAPIRRAGSRPEKIKRN